MRKLSFLTFISVALVLTLLRTGASAQVPYRLNDKQVEQTMHRLKRDSDRFRKSLDSSLDHSRLDGTHREDDINAFMKDFSKETDRLYDRFKDHKSVSSDVETVLDRAAKIEGFMRRRDVFRNDKAERDWSLVRGELDELARAYNVTWSWGA